jgi:hypothetical protein
MRFLFLDFIELTHESKIFVFLLDARVISSSDDDKGEMLHVSLPMKSKLLELF